ncbi:MAG: DUF167 domain-containing protein [Burkholderiaceae bacterium]|nr:DUF167 domain-containing protein [Burkholderiaceae bacterium]
MDRAQLPAWLEGEPGAWRVRIAAQPGAPRTEAVGEHDGCLKLRVAAPAIEGRANDEIVRFLAVRLSLPKRSVRLVSGQTGRRKRFALDAAHDAPALCAALYQGARP